MKNIITLGLAAMPCMLVAQTFNWSHNLGTNGSDSLHAVAYNPVNGDYAVAGRMSWGGANVNPLGTPYSVQSEGNHFLGVYDAAGQIKWAFCPPYLSAAVKSANNGANKALSGNYEYMTWMDVEFTSNGEVVAAGVVDQAGYNYNPFGGSYTANPWCFEMLFARYDLLGNMVWGRSVGASGQCDYSKVNAVAVDASDNLYFGGMLQNSFGYDFDGFGSPPVTAGPTDGGFVASYNGSGNYNWSILIGTSFFDEVTDVATDPSNNLIAAGNWYTNASNFDPKGSGFILTPVGNGDAFIAKYDPSGILIWALNIGSPLNDFIYSVTTDAAGNIYVGGEFNDVADFDPLGAGSVETAQGLSDAFVAKYNSNGVLQWVNTFGSASESEKVTRVRMSNGKLYVSGIFSDTVDFGAQTLTPYGGADGFLLDIDPASGAVNNAEQFGGNSADNVEDAFDNNVANTKMVFGNFRSSAKLNPSSSAFTNGSAGGSDMFMASFCNPINVSFNAPAAVCQGDPVISISGGNPSGGNYSGTGVINNLFYPLITGPGTYPVEYSYTSPFGCSGTAFSNIIVNAEPVVIQGPLADVCLNDDPKQLSGGIPAGGTYSGTGVISGSFYPLVAGAGGYLINYAYTDPLTGCTSSDDAVILVHQNPDVSVSVSNSSCAQNDGEVTASASGGTIPYSFYWSNGVATAVNNNVSSGQYQVTVTDGNGCEDFAIATVSDVNGPQIIVNNIVNTVCPSDTTGQIDVSVSGGASPYTYFWSNGDETEDLINEHAGTYELTVIDANGCEAVQSITLGGPLPIEPNETLSSPTCGNADGSISLAPSGGTGPFTYLWSDLSTGSALTNQPLGLYSVEITDANGCSASFSITLSEQGGPVIDVLSEVASPCGLNAGGININTTGNAPFTYSWSDGASVVSFAQNLSSAPIGNYIVTVSDFQGCSAVAEGNVPAFFPQTEICLVTVDTATGTNLVVWEKPAVSYLSGYRIYRESSVSGQYQPIGFVNYADLSQFVDSVANPLVRGWRYRIAAEDNCGNESPLSLRHKTVHLTNSFGTSGQVNLSWDDYEGFPFSTFDLWRYSDVDGFTLLQSLPSNLRSYTDLNPPTTNTLYYFIEIIPAVPCVSTRAVNHNTTRSNKTQNISPPTGFDELEPISDVTVYPQPTDGAFTITAFMQKEELVDLLIYSAEGRLVYSEKIAWVDGANSWVLNPVLASGAYQLVLETNNFRTSKRLMITH